MGEAIRISVGGVTVAAELNDSPTAQDIFAALPIKGSGSRWGDEIYFSIPVEQSLASDARDEMVVGELAFWPPGNAFCIFFGPTPASLAGEPRAASPANPVGRVTDGVSVLLSSKSGESVTIEKA